MLVIAGIIVVIFLINIILAMTSEVNLNWLTWIVITAGITGLLTWGVLRINESFTIRKYHKYRNQQRSRDKSHL